MNILLLNNIKHFKCGGMFFNIETLANIARHTKKYIQMLQIDISRKRPRRAKKLMILINGEKLRLFNAI